MLSDVTSTAYQQVPARFLSPGGVRRSTRHRAWQILLTTSQDGIILKSRGLQMPLKTCQAILAGPCH